MFFDPTTNSVIDHLGWVDGGSLWHFDLDSNSTTEIAVAGAEYLGLHPGREGLFRVVHHLSDNLAISIRHGSQPEKELSRLEFNGAEPHFSGDSGLWEHVNTAVVMQTRSGPKLIWIDAIRNAARFLDLSWYNGGDYDLGYQGLTDCISIADLGVVVVSVQRSSKLVLIDVEQDRPVGSIILAGRHGNPSLYLWSDTEFMATDYDTLCLVDGKSGSVVRTARLQEAKPPDHHLFIGDYDVSGATCAVARPFSNDVVLLDLSTWKIIGSGSVPAQPLSVCLIPGSRFVVRDWKSGEVHLGRFGRD